MKAPVVSASAYKSPFIEFAPNPDRRMAGKGAPESTVFGVIGRTKLSSESRSLGGLVKETKASAAIQPGTLVHDTKLANTERHVIGPAPKTHIPGTHYGQVPYAGEYMSKKGAPVS